MGKPAVATARQVFGCRSTALATGKNVAGACFARRILTMSRTPSRFQPSSKVSATSFALRDPCCQTRNSSAARMGCLTVAPPEDGGVVAGGADASAGEGEAPAADGEGTRATGDGAAAWPGASTTGDACSRI